ncbi:hypothetical protein Syun_016996 [Stephania yunnanensis]|uniref:Uncharacterized protein n=1 Tax=Stephania yunnanensis TaxID=152371 RepID=A0AAP0P2Y3_9MAGN
MTESSCGRDLGFLSVQHEVLMKLQMKPTLSFLKVHDESLHCRSHKESLTHRRHTHCLREIRRDDEDVEEDCKNSHSKALCRFDVSSNHYCCYYFVNYFLRFYTFGCCYYDLIY